MENIEDLPALIDRVEAVRRRLYELSAGRYPDDRHTTAVLAYLDVTLEHHEAICRLMGLKLFGSACALGRPVVDALFRALWVNGCATDEQVDAVAERDDFDWPKDMMAQVDERYSAQDRFFSTIKKGCWGALCSYAHSGLRQLAKRFSGRRVGPRYSMTDLKEVLDTATASIILLARLLLVCTGRVTEAEETEEMMVAYGEAG
jgi:hypothetical protein